LCIRKVNISRIDWMRRECDKDSFEIKQMISLARMHMRDIPQYSVIRALKTLTKVAYRKTSYTSI
jgi:hypothetical protein